MAEPITTIHLARHGSTVPSAVERFLRPGLGARETIEELRRELSAIASGAAPGSLVVRVDGSAAAAAAGTVVVDQSNCTAGDALIIRVPGYPAFRLVAVADDDDVGASDGTWSIETATDDATGAQLAAAINAHHLLSKFVSAVNTSGSVAITASHAGSGGNDISLTKDVTTSAALAITAMAGGADASERPSLTITCGSADVVEDDTVSIGAVTLTWKDAPSGDESEVDVSTTPATAAANLGAAINGHSKLEGLVSASVDGAVVTLTWLGDARSSQLVGVSRAETNSGSVTVSAAAFAPLTTESYGGTAPRQFALGAPV